MPLPKVVWVPKVVSPGLKPGRGLKLNAIHFSKK